ncbi:MAG: CZB domain-containing protein [Candidatus Omnitrophota bacterium]
MEFKEALEAHVNWRIKLRAYALNADKTLDPAIVGADDKCALGEWLYHEGARFSQFPEYQALKEVHAKFHVCAGRVVAMIHAGQIDEAKNELNAGEYVGFSNLVVEKIIAFESTITS